MSYLFSYVFFFLTKMEQKLDSENRLKKDLEDALKTNIFLEDKLAEMTQENDSLKLALENSAGRRPHFNEQSREVYHPNNNNNSVILPNNNVTDDNHLHGQDVCNPQEVSSLKTHLEDNIKLLTDQVQDLLIQRKASERLLKELKEQNKELQLRLGSMTQEFNITKEAIEEEKQRWSLEKEKVILYQKQLNQNNLQILKRNKDLESELRSLREGYQIRTQEASY